MSFDPSKDCFGTGLSSSVERAQKWIAQTLLHQPALLPFPSAAAFALWVVWLGIGPALRRTQHQQLFFALDLRDLLGVIVTPIHQDRAGSARFGHNRGQRGGKLV